MNKEEILKSFEKEFLDDNRVLRDIHPLGLINFISQSIDQTIQSERNRIIELIDIFHLHEDESSEMKAGCDIATTEIIKSLSDNENPSEFLKKQVEKGDIRNVIRKLSKT